MKLEASNASGALPPRTLHNDIKAVYVVLGTARTILPGRADANFITFA
jgi:hypothetical protein